MMNIRKLSILLAAGEPYAIRIRRIFGADLLQHLPLSETSGTVAADVSGNARDGAYNAPVTLASGVSPSGKPAPLLATRAINIASAGLSAALNGAEGALGSFAQITTGMWSDAAGHYFGRLYVDASNWISLYQGPTVSRLVANYVAAATNEGMAYPAYYTGWFHWLVSWSKSNERTRLYINGVPVASSSALGIWASGALNTSFTRLGGSDLSSNVFTGLLSDFVILGREPTRAEAKTLAGRSVCVAVIGDSIPANSAGIEKWPYTICETYAGGRSATINHAVSGQSIAGHLATQAAAAASDEADLIILALGRNDNNAGDMVALQATIETNIDALRASNPSARICYMNVLPAWTDAGGATPIALENIRGAIAAACAAKAVTCWDTTGWILASDTTDGTHPNQAGHTKIKVAVLAALG